MQTIHVIISTWLMISKGGRWVNWPLLMEDSVGARLSEYARYVYACCVCLPTLPVFMYQLLTIAVCFVVVRDYRVGVELNSILELVKLGPGLRFCRLKYVGIRRVCGR